MLSLISMSLMVTLISANSNSNSTSHATFINQSFSGANTLPTTTSTTSGFDYECFDESCGCKHNPNSAFVLCKYLPNEFIDCEDPVDLDGNVTAKQESGGFGCTKFGGDRIEDVEITKLNCSALPGIECFGPRTFPKHGYPCVKYSGHYFTTTLLYSVLLGFVGVDRFCLGHTGTAVGKLLSLGGLGVWWIIDVILLVTGNLTPNDGSNWEPYY